MRSNENIRDRCIAVCDAFEKFQPHFPALPEEYGPLREVMCDHAYVICALKYILGNAEPWQKQHIEQIMNAANKPEIYVTEFVEAQYGT